MTAAATCCCFCGCSVMTTRIMIFLFNNYYYHFPHLILLSSVIIGVTNYQTWLCLHVEELIDLVWMTGLWQSVNVSQPMNGVMSWGYHLKFIIIIIIFQNGKRYSKGVQVSWHLGKLRKYSWCRTRIALLMLIHVNKMMSCSLCNMKIGNISCHCTI